MGPVCKKCDQNLGSGRYDNQILIPLAIAVHAELENLTRKITGPVYVKTSNFNFQRLRICYIC